MSREIFPQDPNDPFNSSNAERLCQFMTWLSKHSEPCSWQPDSHLSDAMAPKWSLQTAKERQEHQDTVKKLGRSAYPEMVDYN
ncbi:hypothetical protein MBANPS3_006388 [Mucor bainieri]